jgi:signal transduction histidine kinase/ActR/RegA family two-component response regulator
MEEIQDSGGTGTALDFRCLFESAPAPLLVLDRGFRVVAASDAYLEARQAGRDGIIGKEIFTIAGDGPGAADPHIAAELRRSLARVLRDGMADPVNVPVLDRGRVMYIIHRAQDSSEPIAAPPAAAVPAAPGVRAPAAGAPAMDQTQAAFAARVNRELRSPLSTILGFGELLALGDLSEDQREKAWVVVRAARRLETLMNDIQDISRTEDAELSVSVEAASAAQVVAGAIELIEPLAVAHGVHLDAAPASGLYLYADQQRLRQVLLNLLSNSVKYNHPGGQVTASITGQPGNTVRITVTDSGRGMAEADLARLFTPFQRLDAAAAGIEGTGLGLALCQRLVKAMGGQIGVASTKGLGSAFWVDLPAAQPAHPPVPAATRGTAGIRAYAAPKTLLYVEDMVENLRLVEQILKKRPSVRLVPAMLGGVALDLATQHHPDVILLDLHLPDITGEELLRRFQADPATSRTPVVILSADAAEAQIARLLAAGAAAYVTKPIGVRSFLETVDRLVGQAPAAGTGPAAGLPRATGTTGISAGGQAGATPAAVDDGHDAG